MRFLRHFAIRCTLLVIPCVLLAGTTQAQDKKSKYACSEPNLASICTASNTCGSSSEPCFVDVKRTANSASATPSIPNAKGNSLFCIKAGTKVEWKSTGKDIGFVVDFGPNTPFDHSGAIIGGSDRTVSTVAQKPGCYKYSAGACRSGAIYGMCGQANVQLIIIP